MQNEQVQENDRLSAWLRISVAGFLQLYLFLDH